MAYLQKGFWNLFCIVGAFGILCKMGCQGGGNKHSAQFPMTRQQIIEKTLRPYQGPSAIAVSNDSLEGKIMTGYQGWFTCPDDGAMMGWFHWGLPREAPSSDFYPGRCSIDLWPDMSEYDDDEKCATAFRHADGSVAYVFSSMNPKTVLRHFRWMQEYGIDGAFVQRFAAQTFKDFEYHNVNQVLANCRAAANQTNRLYAVMYDLTGLKKGQILDVIQDWKVLVDKMGLTRDPNDTAYLRHRGKPVIAVWGIGFSDNRQYSLKECDQLIEFFKNDPCYGGLTVMIGCPTHWRTLDKDALSDSFLHTILKKADIVSPWTVGRIRKLEEIESVLAPIWQADMQWCAQQGLDYMPVVWPGFSWHNMYGWGFDLVPRLKGDFLWQQYYHLCRLNATMIYQAMFDEVDEATAIFKCTNDPPVGPSKFLTYEGLSSDFYLRLVGFAGRMLRGKAPLLKDIPIE